MRIKLHLILMKLSQCGCAVGSALLAMTHIKQIEAMGVNIILAVLFILEFILYPQFA